MLIKKIPLSSRERSDSWFWLFDAKGCFTIKSCYRLLQGEADTSYAQFWMKVWGLKLPAKVTYFLWRVSALCLPITTRLEDKRVQVDTNCQWYHAYHETYIHVLFVCEIANAVWLEVGLKIVITVLPDDNILEIIRRVFVKCNKEQFRFVALVCWSIWNRMNKWVWDKANVSAFGIKAAALNNLTEWNKAQEQQVITTTSTGALVAVRR